MNNMTTNELLRKILAILPNAVLEKDLEGQLIIYTNKRETSSGEITEYEVTN